MAHRSNVPKFGNWEENENDVPYTVFFEKARKKNRGTKMINPINNPSDTIDHSLVAHAQPKPEEPPTIVRASMRPTRGHNRPNQEAVDHGQLVSSTSRSERTARQNIANESSYGGREQRQARLAARPSAGFDQGFERSPVKVTGRGSTVSTGWDDSSHGGSAVGKSRARPLPREDESPNGGAAVPRFGEWNENDPQAAEQFTHIFNQVREERERNNEAGNASNKLTSKRSPYTPPAQEHSDEPKKCCFPWW